MKPASTRTDELIAGTKVLGTREQHLRAATAKERSRIQSRRSIAVQTGLYPALGVFGALLVWELATVAFAIPRFLVPRPSEVAQVMIVRRDLLFSHGVTTASEVLLAFVISILIALPIAVLITYSRPLERVIYPLLVSSQTIPKIALAPLFVIWFGFGITPKIIIAVLIAFFPVVISSVVGLKSCPPELLHLVRSMGATPWQTFWKIRFPTALPSIFGGLKVAMTLAVVGAIVGEFVGADRGLGYLISISNSALDTPLLFASIAYLSILGVMLFLLVDVVERRVLRWHPSTRLDQLSGGM